MKALEYFGKLIELKQTKETNFLIQNRFAFAEHFAERQNKELIEENKRLKDDLKFRKSILSDRAQNL